MGTDLHSFIEIDYDKLATPFTSVDILAFNTGPFHTKRDYLLFNLLGDGRNRHLAPEKREVYSVFQPRGLPDHVSSSVRANYYHPISPRTRHIDSNSFSFSSIEPGLPSVAEPVAKQWVRDGISVLSDDELLVSCPFWHSPSWLYLNEVEAVLMRRGGPLNVSADFLSIVESMKILATEHGAERVRLVFWFDS